MNSCRHYPTGRDVGLGNRQTGIRTAMRDFVFAQVRRTIKRVIQFTLPLPLAPSNPPHSVRPQLPSRPFRHAAQRPPPPSERDASGLSIPPPRLGVDARGLLGQACETRYECECVSAVDLGRCVCAKYETRESMVPCPDASRE